MISNVDQAELSKCFRDQIIDCVVNKNLLGHSMLDLNAKMVKLSQQMSIDTASVSFQSLGLQRPIVGGNTNKKYIITDFNSIDYLT